MGCRWCCRSSAVHCLVRDALHNPFSPESLSVLAAEQLLGNSVLLRQGLRSNKLHGAVEVVEVAAYEHFDPGAVAHGSVDLLEESNSLLVSCNSRTGIQFHIIHVVSWRTAGRRTCELLWYKEVERFMGIKTQRGFLSGLCLYLERCERCDDPRRQTQHRCDPPRRALPSQTWGNRPCACGAHRLGKRTKSRPEEEKKDLKV